jgi:hypothetical protein
MKLDIAKNYPLEERRRILSNYLKQRILAKQNNQVKEDEMGRARNTNGDEEESI